MSFSSPMKWIVMIVESIQGFNNITPGLRKMLREVNVIVMLVTP